LLRVSTGYSASDLKLIVDEAARDELLNGREIASASLLHVFDRVPPSIAQADIERYAGFGSRGFRPAPK
jgi:hypothetical protein